MTWTSELSPVPVLSSYLRGSEMRTFSFLGFVWLLIETSLGLQQDWHSCSVNSCNAGLQAHQCSVPGGQCHCSLPSNGSSTCGMQPTTLANLTGAPLNTSMGPLSCCICPSNSTICCQSNCTNTTTASTTAAPSTTAVPTTSFVYTKYAKLVAAFVVDCSSYNTTLLAILFRQAIINQTTLTGVDVTRVTCLSGYQPFCGVDVSIVGAAHHRARRLAVGRRASSNDKKSSPDGVSFSFSTQQYYSTEEQKVPCKSLAINVTLWEHPSTPNTLENSLITINSHVVNGTFGVNLPDHTNIKATFLISAMKNNTFAISVSPYIYKEPVPTTQPIPPLETNLKPLIYTGGAVLGLVFLCVIYQLAKQSWLLRRRKFTDINSDPVNSRKDKVLEVMESQEEEEDKDHEQSQFNMTFSSPPRAQNDALTRRYDWTTPTYLPSMLAPAYKPTEYHGQQSPPRLILDDEESDGEKNSLGKASVINVDDETDDDLRDILESDDEFERPTSKKSTRSTIKQSTPTTNPRKTSAAPASPRKPSGSSRNTRKSSAMSNKSQPQPPPGRQRKCSYMGPEGREALKGQKSPTPSIKLLKNNKITPVPGDRKASVSSLKPPKHSGTTEC